jgi:hypothetical protein
MRVGGGGAQRSCLRHCWGVTFKATINEQPLKIAAAAPRSSTGVVRNFFTDIKIRTHHRTRVVCHRSKRFLTARGTPPARRPNQHRI